MSKWKPKKNTEMIIDEWQCAFCGTKQDAPRSMERVSSEYAILECVDCKRKSEVVSYPSWSFDAELIEENKSEY